MISSRFELVQEREDKLANKQIPNQKGDIITIGNVGSGATVAAGKGASVTRAEGSLFTRLGMPPPIDVPAQKQLEPAQSTIGQYQLIELLGEGGMAQVYKACQPSLERDVAIKFIRPEFSSDKNFRARFEREAKVIAPLSHGGIVHVYDFGEENGHYYLVMEFIEGRTLREHLDQLSATGQKLNLAQVLWLIQQIGAALDYAHQRGIIHRDIKPDNVMLTTEGRVVLTDFGIAKIVGGTDNLTRTGMMPGTPAYMSPEQIEGDKTKMGPASDLYSVGIMLYEMVTGQKPFSASTAQALMWKHLHEPVPPPRHLNPTLPESLERVILTTLAKKPTERYQRAATLVKAVQQAIAEEATPIRVPPSQKKASQAAHIPPTEAATPFPPTVPAQQKRVSKQTTAPSPSSRPSARRRRPKKTFWQKVPSWLWATLAGCFVLVVVIGMMVML